MRMLNRERERERGWRWGWGGGGEGDRGREGKKEDVGSLFYLRGRLGVDEKGGKIGGGEG